MHCSTNQDTACSHVTDKNTTVSVTQIMYDNKFFVTCALASRYQYVEELEDASSAQFATMAGMVRTEIETQLMNTREGRTRVYDVVIVQFQSISSRPSLPTASLQGSSLLADLIISTSSDSEDPLSLQGVLAEAAVLPDGTSLFSVLTMPSTVNVCLLEVIHTSQGRLTWPITEVDTTTGSVELCPLGFERAGEFAIATRSCVRDSAGHAAWAQFVCANCGEVTEEGELLQLGDQITSGGSDDESDPNLDIVTSAIALFRSTPDISSIGILAVTRILESLARLNSVSAEVTTEVGTLVDLTLDIDLEVIVEAESEYRTSSRINSALRGILAITALEDDQQNFTVSNANVVFRIQRLNVDRLLDYHWYGTSVYPPSSGNTRTPPAFHETPTLDYDTSAEASLHFQFDELPPSVLGDPRLTYIFHPGDKLYQSFGGPATEGVQFRANGWITSVAVAGIQGLPRGTITTTGRQNVLTVDGPMCGAWNATSHDGHGSWSDTGCQQLPHDLPQGLVVCQCDHLGAVALVRDVSADLVTPHPVSAIVFVGAALAFLSAFGCSVIFVACKKLRRKQLYRIEASFCLAVALFYLVFAAGVSAPSMSLGCLIVAVFLHYLLLVAACSMIAVAWKFFDTSWQKAAESKWFAFNRLLPAWGVPTFVVVVSAAPNPQVYHNSIPRCFLSSELPYALVFSLTLPVIACLVITAVLLSLTNRNVVKQTGEGSSATREGGAKPPWAWLTTSRIVQVTALFIICYITWLFLLAVVYSTLPGLQYVFGIAAIVQAVAFLLILCILDEDVRLAVMAVSGKGRQSSRSFQPYFSASQWHPNPDIVPENAPKQFLDDTQANSTLTRQNFNPKNIPLSNLEKHRIGEENGHINPSAEIQNENEEHAL
ncbi:uncharacterized protein [Diadema antillarum]|uniref:uncharacterized protein n=1 Tax=Diadema antillarum TaxID=105358 RepID=UPI003A8365D3